MTDYITIDTTRLAIAIGLGAATGETASNYNHFVGHYAGNSAITGFNNCGFGLQVLSEATTAQACTVMGLQAGQHITTAQQATLYGIHAGLSLTTGFGNVAVGAGSMEYGTTFEYNTAIGTYAGRDNQANRCIFIGNRAGITHTVGDGAVYIGQFQDDSDALYRGEIDDREAWVNGTFKAEQFILDDLNAAPASASDTGTRGEIRVTATHIFVCTATNTWVRAALASW